MNTKISNFKFPSLRLASSQAGQIPNRNSGQTIIETLAAIFILVTTLTVGLGLAISVLSSSEGSIKEMTATNLARQGIEIVRMMRDSNWLAGEATNLPGFALEPCGDIGNNLCYPEVFTGGVGGQPLYNNDFDLITPSQPVCDEFSINCNRSITIQRDFSSWKNQDFYAIQAGDPSNYGVYLDGTTSIYSHTFPPGCFNAANCPPEYIRKIKLSRINIAPYTNSNSNWQLMVNVYVAWTGKRCNNNIANQDPETFNTPCKLALEERLTNWKDYR